MAAAYRHSRQHPKRREKQRKQKTRLPLNFLLASARVCVFKLELVTPPHRTSMYPPSTVPCIPVLQRATAILSFIKPRLLSHKRNMYNLPHLQAYDDD